MGSPIKVIPLPPGGVIQQIRKADARHGGGELASLCTSALAGDDPVAKTILARLCSAVIESDPLLSALLRCRVRLAADADHAADPDDDAAVQAADAALGEAIASPHVTEAWGAIR